MWRYRTLLLIIAAPFILHVLWLALRYRDLRFLLERTGLFFPGLTQDGLLIHAASVGEVKAVIPLLHAFREQYPDLAITLSTTTPTGGITAHENLPAGMNQCYLPMDWTWAIRVFLNRIQPQCVFITETEIWPNLYQQCHKKKIPVLIINGRISDKTLRAPPWLQTIYRDTLNKVKVVLARSEIDRDGYTQLGVPAEKIEVTGNIKFASQAQETRDSNIGINKPYVLAASTRDNEEKEIVKAWQAADHDEHFLVIVPRHPKRLKDILQGIKPLSSHIAIRSKGQEPSAQTEIYIADTIGELTGFMQNAVLVFMGGSLVPRGGQNILEPARLGKPIIFGPHMDNFADEAKLLLDNEAAVQIEDTDALQQALTRLLAAPEQATRMGEKARHAIRKQEDVLARYLAAIARHCPLAT